MNIIYQTAEDGLADTVKPRLEAGDADCEKIMVIDESEKCNKLNRKHHLDRQGHRVACLV